MTGRVDLSPVHTGEILRDELEEIGLTQSTLAKHIGVLPKTINKICRKKRVEELRKWFNQLGVTYEERNDL